MDAKEEAKKVYLPVVLKCSVFLRYWNLTSICAANVPIVPQAFMLHLKTGIFASKSGTIFQVKILIFVSGVDGASNIGDLHRR